MTHPYRWCPKDIRSSADEAFMHAVRGLERANKAHGTAIQIRQESERSLAENHFREGFAHAMGLTKEKRKK